MRIVSRVKKILIASLVLAAGFGLAWPFRQPPHRQAESLVSPQAPVADAQLAVNDRSQASIDGNNTRFSAGRIEATTASGTAASPVTPTIEASLEPSRTTFDLANHPAIVRSPPRTKSPASDPPAPSSNDSASPPQIEREPHQPREVVHIVRNIDTLEKIAERYLGDPGRAFEIFDYNRDQLDNPHQPLPIGAELRIRVDLDYKFD